ncbi:MAG: nucleoside triphosphate pyrophosphohydrolase [Candidatus Falkowbacteria bacterium]|nr:nucleoside triphosphate pyrophosphohydrolase [Candidatus Falkowbacteria bacterium]
MKVYNKLVRDKILEIIKTSGQEAKARVLSEEEYRRELLKKLVEEANEVLAAGEDRPALTKEIGDVLTVIDYIIKAFYLSREEIETLKKFREETRGGFKERIFLESVE